jgi:hypothetical protein
MSTSIPLTLIEGAMAIPRLRPLDRLPAPFGRDWAFLPPHVSLRAELKALYAAVLRTFCVNTAAFRALCHWDARRLVSRTSTPDHTLKSGDAWTRPSASDTKQEPADFVASAASAIPYRSLTSRTALAGGACMLGGAAMLTWLAISHTSQHQTSVSVVRDDRAAKQMTAVNQGEGAAQLTPAMPNSGAIALSIPNPAVPLKPVAGAPKTSSAVENPSSRSLSESQARRTPQPASSPNRRIAAPTRNANAQAREADRRPSGKLHRVTARAASESHASANAFSPRTKTRIEAPAFNPRSAAKPSSAGGFSPFAPATLGADEYASIRMSASTHPRDIAPAGTQSRPVNTDSTDWTSRLSQRRVTDATDEFAR